MLQHHAERLGWKPAETTVAVQGFGNVGMWFARLAHGFGFKIVAVSDSSGGIYNADGLDPQQLETWKQEMGSFQKIAAEKNITFVAADEFVGVQADVLAPAALENAITADNVSQIVAHTVLELANGPTTPEAEAILVKNNVIVIPDVLANAGGVTVSYYEWVQNLSGDQWNAERVENSLRDKMLTAYDSIADWQERLEVSYRQAAYILAVKRVIDAMFLRGWV
ncbi:hypothetical protein LRY60_03685 [Candidatus Woesebacteria bacterium]|nr:hypothetical protein [Candidatus Woesebacteria bacterium]